MSQAPAPEEQPEEQPAELDEVGGAAERLASTVPPAEIRDLGDTEREALEACLRLHGDDVLARLEADHVFKVLAREDISPQRRVVRLRRERLADLAPYPLIHLGMPIVGLARKGARLTLEGAALVARHATRRVVIVDDKGAQLFLYGRHLLLRSIVHVRGNIDEGDEVLVVEDEGKRCIGLGVARLAMQGGDAVRRMKRGPAGEAQLAVAARVDLGLYLRAQQEIPQ